MFYNEGGETLL